MPELRLEDVGKFILDEAKSLGATDVAAVVHKIKEAQVRFSRNNIDIMKFWEYYHAVIFVTVGKRVGYSEIRSNKQEDLRQAILNAISLAKVSEERKDFEGLYPGGNEYSQYKGISENVIDPEKMADAAVATINAALNTGAKRVAGVVYASSYERGVFTSNGIEIVRSPGRTSVEISTRAFYEPEISGHGISVGVRWKDVDPERAGKDAGEIALTSTNIVKIDSKTYDVVFYPMAIGNLLNYLAMLLSGFYVYVKMSPFTGRLGEEIASQEFTLIDNPLREDSVGFVTEDDEGCPTRKKTLIEKGTLKTYLLNYWLSKHFNLENTGNAGIIFPRPFTLEVMPGTSSRDGLISDIKEGIVVTNTWYTRFQNYYTGDFSTVPRDNAFYVKNGEIVGVARNLRISDNLILMFSRIKAVANDVDQVRWWEVQVPTYTPSILIENTKITTH